MDCRHINLHLYKNKFKYEDVSIARHFLQKGDFVFSFDLKSAYHHIEIFDEHRTYLGFSGLVNGKTRYLVFNVLAFGISTAGYIFSKVTREMVKYWRSKALKVIMYLDDGICGCSSYDVALVTSNFIKQSLESFGFIIAHEKCTWDPSRVATWLGILWDFTTGKIHITVDRIQRFMKEFELVLNLLYVGKRYIHVKVLACIVGQIISMQMVIGHVTRLKTRALYECIISRASWNSIVLISSEAISEIYFWRDNLVSLNSIGSDFVTIENYTLMAYSDASGIGYAGYIATCDGVLYEDSEVLGSWSEQEQSYSSTWRELEGLHRVLASSVDTMGGNKIKWITDSKNVVSIVQVGSTKPYLQDISIQIDQLCSINDIELLPVWMPRKNIQHADFLSRCSDSDDWGISAYIFDDFNKVWGPYSIDCFATDYNAKCNRFYSRWWCPRTLGIDAFKFSWSRENCWLVPPPRLICKVIHKLKADKTSGTLVVPEWKSAPFWPLLHSNDSYSKYVKGRFVLDKRHLIVSGRGKNGIFVNEKLKFQMVAFKLDFRL